jgi:hypothetical protein
VGNFVFYAVWMWCTHAWNWKRILFFFAGNVVVALSFLPFFFYMIMYMKYDFTREFTPGIWHTFVFMTIMVMFISFFLLRKKLADINNRLRIIKNGQGAFLAYLLGIPALIFIFTYLISFFKPMIAFRYLWPINAPFCFAVIAAAVSCIGTQKKLRFVLPLLVYAFTVGLYGLRADIPGGGAEAYREARAYIAADAAAHPERKTAMLDNAPQNALYYGFPVIPQYSDVMPVDVLYVYNDIFMMHEMDMYDMLRAYNLDDAELLKIQFDYEYPRGDGGVIFKKYFQQGL